MTTSGRTAVAGLAVAGLAAASVAASAGAQQQTNPAGPSTDATPEMTYYLLEGARYFDILIARIGTREYTVIGELDAMCLELPDQRDYDGDGARDALVRSTDACGSVDTPGTLFFVSGSQGFPRSNHFSGDRPEIEQWEGLWSVVTESGRHVLQRGRALRVEQ